MASEFESIELQQFLLYLNFLYLLFIIELNFLKQFLVI